MEENTRVELADKMEIIGQVFEIDGMTDLLNKYRAGLSMVQFNAITIQVGGLLLKKDKTLADRIIAMSMEVPDEEVQALEDAAYANALKNAIIKDIMGFFASSPPTAGRK